MMTDPIADLLTRIRNALHTRAADCTAPGSRLKALKGSLRGLYAIRINDQWRITFRWTPNGPADVDIVDYH